MHVGVRSTADALPAIIANLQGRGFRLVTISELFGLRPKRTKTREQEMRGNSQLLRSGRSQAREAHNMKTPLMLLITNDDGLEDLAAQSWK